MSLQTLLTLAVQGILFLIVFAIGLSATVADATYLFRRPKELARALFVLNVLMPLFAVVLVSLFDLRPVVKVIIVALSISPIPPMRPTRIMGAGGMGSYAVGVVIATSLLAIVLVPVSLAILGQVFNLPLQFSPVSIAALVFTTLLLPNGLGMAVKRFAPRLAERLIKPILLTAFILGTLCVLVVLYASAPAMWTLVGNGTVVAFAAFVIVGLTIGHFLGGPERKNRIALAIAAPSRNKILALYIVQANFPEEKLAFAALLIYLFADIGLSVAYRRLISTLGPDAADEAEA